VVRSINEVTNEIDAFDRQARRKPQPQLQLWRGFATTPGGRMRDFMSSVWRNGPLERVRSLNVYADDRLVGALHEGDDLWRFGYDPDWAAAPDGFDLAPGLPREQALHVDGGTSRPVQWFFDNLLPEELLRQAISKEAGIVGDDAFALLQYLGAESAGSLTLLAPGQALPARPASGALPDAPDRGRYYELSDAHLSQRIAALPGRTLLEGARKRMSLAGAQHKLLVAYHDGALYEPEGAAPSTHILKPDHPERGSFPASAVNEYLCMRLAQAAGLAVPAVHLRHVPEPVYIVDRFDRRVTAQGVQRLHIIDACQLLNRARTFKYSGASLQILLQIIQRTTNRLHTRLQLFRWLVFNVVMGNDDCHLKNLSFFMAADGIKLAPHYDLLATCAYHTKAFANDKARWPNVPMAIALPNARLFAEVSAASLLAAAQELGVPSAAAQRILSQVSTRVAAGLPQQIDEITKHHALLPVQARVHVGAEVRLMRVVQSIVVRDMLERL